MSQPITISNDELWLAVEEILDRHILGPAFEKAAKYARRKLELAQQRNPDVDYYNDSYLAMLTADTVRENEFAEALNARNAILMGRAGA